MQETLPGTERVLPLVTVVIVSHNGGGNVERCLESVCNTAYPNLDVVLIDNASRDMSVNVERIRSRFANVRVLCMSKNLGTIAYNEGARSAHGDFVAFLHVDQLVTPEWVTELLRPMMEDNSIGAAQSKVLLFGTPPMIDSAGCFIDILGHSVQRGHNERDMGQYDKIDEIFFAKNAGILIRRSLIDRIGVYDPTFFLWSEEADFGWRVWMSGYRVVFVPSSVVFHNLYQGGTRTFAPSIASFHITKNRISMLIKNCDLYWLALAVPCSVVIVSGMALVLGLTGNSQRGVGYFQGVYWVFRHLRDIWRSRLRVQLGFRRALGSKFLFEKKLVRRLDTTGFHPRVS